MSKLTRSGDKTYGWNASKAGDVRLGCLEKRKSATSVSVFTSVLLGRIRPPLSRPVNQRTFCLSPPWRNTGTKTFRICSSVSYLWYVGCWRKIVSVVSYDRATCYPLSHKSMQYARHQGMSLALMTPFFWWRTKMKNISLSSRYKRAKTALIVSAGKKWVQLEKEYIHSYCISGVNIWMAGGKGGDLSARKRVLFIIYFLTRL